MTLKELLPWTAFDQTILNVELRQALVLLALVVAVWILSWPIGYLLLRGARALASRTRSTLDDEVVSAAVGPVRFLVCLFLFGAGLLPLGIGEPMLGILLWVLKASALLAFTVVAMRLVDLLASAVQGRMQRKGRVALLSVLPTGRKATKAAVFVLAVLVLLQNLGVNVAGLIAGLGIGGLAVALAAQETLKDLLGGLSVLADRPVRVGDFCKAGDLMGTVEEIGLRSTRLRTLDRTVVAVPNAQFASMSLENYAVRDRMRLYAVLGVRYETTPDQLRWLLVEVRKLLLSHPRVTPDPARVRFINFGAYSLDLEVFAYVDTRDWPEFLGIREDIYLRIMDLVEASGSGFAFPSTTTYLGRDDGLDAEKQAEAEGAVRALREEGNLPLPNPSPAMIREIDDTLDWPPRGSVTP